MVQTTAIRDNQAIRPRAKVLIVDDSVVARGLFSRWVGEHPQLMVVASAADGVAAVAAAAKHQPDIVILDLDMPIMDGLTALPEILKASPGSSVVIASSLTARSARLSMQCLSLGAVEVQPKPDSNRHLTMSMDFRQELMRKLEGLLDAKPRSNRHPSARLLALAQSEMGKPEETGRLHTETSASALDIMPRALLIGASTGGPRAVTTLLESMDRAGDRFPVFIAQHMPAVFTASFAEQLETRLKRPAREAEHGELAVAGTIYVAPGGRHLRLDKSDGQIRMLLDDTPPVKFCRPSVDVLFSDAAAVYGASALAVILTGMGTDGLDGAQLLRKAGARIIAQDEATSVVWGMPGAVCRAGFAHQVLPIHQIGPAILASIQPGARS